MDLDVNVVSYLLWICDYDYDLYPPKNIKTQVKDTKLSPQQPKHSSICQAPTRLGDADHSFICQLG